MTPNPDLTSILEILRSKHFLIIFSLLTAILTLMTYNNTLGAKGQEFASLTTLGRNMHTDDYFLNKGNTIRPGDDMNWHILVHNGMDNSEYISVRVKLINATQQIPNDTTRQPSPEIEILELRNMLAKNSTWNVPLDWKIKQVDRESGYVVIKAVTMNGNDISNLQIKSLNGQNFKVVLELWRYDIKAKDFVFAWSSGNDSRSVWNQIWFNVAI